MNIGFKYASGKYILMVSDDLILEKGCIQKGYNEMERRINNGEKIGAGSFYFREYPRFNYYRVGVLPKNLIALNHGFYTKGALEDVGYLDEKNYNFYCSDGDIIMRMEEVGWKSIDLRDCFADHLCHLPQINKNKIPLSIIRDTTFFNKKYPYKRDKNKKKVFVKTKIDRSAFFWTSPQNVIIGYILFLISLIKKK